MTAGIAGWSAGMLFSLIGLINIGWGNDPVYGVFITGLSLIFYPPLSDFFTRITGWKVPVLVKILVALFILWSSLGVGELFRKIEMMRAALFER